MFLNFNQAAAYVAWHVASSPAASLPAPATVPPGDPHVSPDVSTAAKKTHSQSMDDAAVLYFSPLDLHHRSRTTMGGSRSNGGRTTEAAAAASGTATTVVALVLLLVAASVVVFLLSPTPAATRIGHGEGGPRREPVELAIGLAGHESWLDAIRAWAKLACLKLRPPEPRYDLRSPASVKAAAKESLEMGKETVEHAAESAARAAEETLGKTTVKLKRKLSPPPPPPSPAGGCLDGDL